MHPMFVELFLADDTDERLTEAEHKRRRASRARRVRPRATARVAARGRNHRPRA